MNMVEVPVILILYSIVEVGVDYNPVEKAYYLTLSVDSFDNLMSVVMNLYY